MLVLNDSATAFWMGNLVNKNLDGREILSQVFNRLIPGSISVFIVTQRKYTLLHLLLQTSSEETTAVDAISEELINASSDVLDSDLGEDLMEETDNEDNN